MTCTLYSLYNFHFSKNIMFTCLQTVDQQLCFLPSIIFFLNWANYNYSSKLDSKVASSRQSSCTSPGFPPQTHLDQCSSNMMVLPSHLFIWLPVTVAGELLQVFSGSLLICQCVELVDGLSQ